MGVGIRRTLLGGGVGPGMGYLVSQQLVVAGERVIDVPAMMASRVRVLGPASAQSWMPFWCTLFEMVVVAHIRAICAPSVEEVLDVSRYG